MSTIQRRELARFRNHVKKLAEKDHLGVDGFDAELNQLRQVDQRVRSNLDEFYTGSLGSSLAKNRFDDVKPNEGTIVRLKPVSKNGEGTYINANYIDARETLEVPFVYIATQAPLENTVLDFWRMIYENDVAFIVMLCNTQENGKSKSKMYWPAVGEVIDLKLLSITNVGEKSHQDSVHRTLVLRTIRGDERTITHMQHLGWPDEGVPESSVPLMMMIQEIAKSPRSVTSPIVVHCSGGVGRTGVFISMHVLLGQFQQERTHMSVPRVVHFLKLCRSGMVQRKDQYLYLYYATLREMERMVLSCDTGRDLLTGASVTRQVHSSSLRIDTDTTTGPPVMLLPAKVTSHKKWKLANLFKYGSAEPTDGKEKIKKEGSGSSSSTRKERSSRTKGREKSGADGLSDHSSQITSPCTSMSTSKHSFLAVTGENSLTSLSPNYLGQPAKPSSAPPSPLPNFASPPMSPNPPANYNDYHTDVNALEGELNRVKYANRLKKLSY